LAQQPDTLTEGNAPKTVARRQPTETERAAMTFGWRVVKHVKSNAIVFAGADRTLSIGAGQMSRVDASRIAVWKAGEAGLSLRGSVVCSDAFFPFADGLIAAAAAGATAAVQPGGSVRDAEVIGAADARGLAMACPGDLQMPIPSPGFIHPQGGSSRATHRKREMAGQNILARHFSRKDIKLADHQILRGTWIESPGKTGRSNFGFSRALMQSITYLF